VNVIQPGAIETESNPNSGDFAQILREMAALGRFGQPEEIAGAVAFLVGPDRLHHLRHPQCRWRAGDLNRRQPGVPAIPSVGRSSFRDQCVVHAAIV